MAREGEASGDGGDSGTARCHDRISKSGLLTEPITDRMDPQLVTLNLCAGIVALIGLFRDNPTIVIGAMIISPLLSPLYSFSVYVFAGDVRRASRNLSVLVVLVLLLIAFSAGTTYVLQWFYTLRPTSEIAARLSYDALDIVIAVVLGIAMVVSHTRKFLSSMVGIGIAIALVPPAVTVGISLAANPGGVFPSFLLLADSAVGLITGSLGTLLIIGLTGCGPLKQNANRGILTGILLLIGLCTAFLTGTLLVR